jgi:aspartate aminotransferase-like enzyme
MAHVVHEWAERSADLGVSVLAPKGHRSPTVTVLTLSERTPTAHVLHAMKTRGFTIGAGYGPLSSGSVRIGHMGEHTVEGVASCLDALEDSLKRLSLKSKV